MYIHRELSKIQWDVIVVDEAHKLKNYDSKLSSALRDEYHYQNCLLLTGNIYRFIFITYAFIAGFVFFVRLDRTFL
jgi:hypothetical protein